MSSTKDLISLLRALELVGTAAIKLQKDSLGHLFSTSSIPRFVQQSLENCSSLTAKSPVPAGIELINKTQDGAERLKTVIQGLKVYGDLSFGETPTFGEPPTLPTSSPTSTLKIFTTTHPSPKVTKNNSVSTKSHAKTVNVEPVTLKEKPKERSFHDSNFSTKIELTKADKELLKRLDMEHRAKLVRQSEMQDKRRSESAEKETRNVENVDNLRDGAILTSIPTTVPNPKSKQKLSNDAKQRKVPSSRIGRMMSFGSLAAGLGIGTATEYVKNSFGMGETRNGMVFLSKSNLERIVDTLCKVRGAALKLGQIMSIQDESIVHPDLAKALERVRKSADFMPDWQLKQVMESELGPKWLENFAEFEMKPFAAASIGQVHYGKLIDGREVAIKVQYPGVAKGIYSDIDNLGGIMKMWNIFPKGMFLENLMTVAKRELAWEVDYEREAECTKKFKTILLPYPEFYVPDVVDHLSTKQVFTTELLDGMPIDQCFDLDLSHRQFVGEKIMDLCLAEILRFRYMQTDPNWANFLYNPNRRQLMLLDFGASREYSREFMDKYVVILKAACDDDRDTVLNVSKEMGFLTGYESKIMEEAHVDSVMILGEIFRVPDKYDFGQQDMTRRIQDLAQIMLVHRLCPPPEEVYSLHRKLSGVFLLLSKLRIKMDCRTKFLELYDEYQRNHS